MRPFIAPTYDQACFLRRNVLPFTVFFSRLQQYPKGKQVPPPSLCPASLLTITLSRQEINQDVRTLI